MATPPTKAGLLLKSPFVFSVSSVHRSLRPVVRLLKLMTCAVPLSSTCFPLCALMPSSLISPKGLMLFAGFIFIIHFALVALEDMRHTLVSLASLASLAFSENVLKIAAGSEAHFI